MKKKSRSLKPLKDDVFRTKTNESYLISTHISQNTNKDGEISTENALRMMLAESWQVKKKVAQTLCIYQSGFWPVF